MIKIAKTNEEIKKCLDFIEKEGGYHILKETTLYYIETNNNEILCVAGINRHFGSCIEPLISVNKMASLKMFYFLQGVLYTLGFRYIIVKTINEKVIRYLIGHEGFKVYNKNNNEFIKELY